MGLAVLAEARVVVGCGDIDHLGIHVIEAAQLQRLPDHGQDMVAAVPLVEAVIAGNDVCLHVLAQSRPDRSGRRIGIGSF